MNAQLTVFLTVSLVIHAGLLSREPGKEPLVLAIGGQAQAINVSVIQHARPKHPQQPLAALEVAHAKPVTHPTPVASKPKATTITPRTNQQAPEPGTLSTTARQLMRASAIITQRPDTSPGSSAESISAALQNKLASRFEYPWLARKRGWQGQVTLSLQIDSNGSLSDWQIASTSGYGVLDRSALKAAKAIQYLPEAENLPDGKPLHLLIPVHYQLLDS